MVGFNFKSTVGYNFKSTVGFNFKPTVGFNFKPTVGFNFKPTVGFYLRLGSTSNLRLGSTSSLRLGSTSSLRLGSTSNLQLGSTSNLGLGSTSNLRLGSTSKLRSTSSLHMIIVMWSLAVSHPLCEIIWAYVLSSQFHCAESQVHLNENYIFHRQVQIMIVCMINGMHMKMWSPVWQAFQPTALFFLAPDMCRNDIHWSL